MSDLKALLARVAQLDEGLAQELGRHLERAGHRDEWVHDPDGEIRRLAEPARFVMATASEMDERPPIGVAYYIASSALAWAEDERGDVDHGTFERRVINGLLRHKANQRSERRAYDALGVTVRVGDPVVEPARISGHIALDDDPDQIIAPGAFGLPAHESMFTAQYGGEDFPPITADGHATIDDFDRSDAATSPERVFALANEQLEARGLCIHSWEVVRRDRGIREPRIWSWRWRTSFGRGCSRQVGFNPDRDANFIVPVIVGTVLEEEGDHE